MFGFKFENHPNLKRILMWDEYPYYPLRKEFPLAGIDTPLPAADVVEATNASVEPAPMMGGPFVSSGDGPMSEAEPRAKDESWTEETENQYEYNYHKRNIHWRCCCFVRVLIGQMDGEVKWL